MSSLTPCCDGSAIYDYEYLNKEIVISAVIYKVYKLNFKNNAHFYLLMKLCELHIIYLGIDRFNDSAEFTFFAAFIMQISHHLPQD